MNENDSFLKNMKGVNPIKKNNRIKKKQQTKPIFKVKKNEIKKNELLIENIKTNTKQSEFILHNQNIKKNIKKGSLKIDRKIDFHGKTLIESEELFATTIIGCYQRNLRCLLFVTGKGLFTPKHINNNDKPKLYHGVIRNALIDWVKLKKFSKYILSFEQASIDHGGDGAFYVYLRKEKN